MKFSLPPLPYSFDALEPYLDAETMEIHYTKHHQTYLDKFNAVVEKYAELAEMTAEDMLKNLNSLLVGGADRAAIKNFGGGFVNHNIYWYAMGPKKELDQKLVEEINKTFGSVDAFHEEFSLASTNHFGSGYGWLVRDEKGELKIYSLPNQDSPYTLGHEPIFCLDVWEHAYYLKYRHKRADFVKEWWNALKMI